MATCKWRKRNLGDYFQWEHMWILSQSLFTCANWRTSVEVLPSCTWLQEQALYLPFLSMVVVTSCMIFFSSLSAGSIRLDISLPLSSPSLPHHLTHSRPLSATCTRVTHAHTGDIKRAAFWRINLYILEPIPVSASILQRPCLLLSWVPLQPSGVISLLAVLNSLIICVLHKKRTIP